MHRVSSYAFASTPIAPSIANVGEHTRSGSPEPLPVLPRHHKDAYRGDRMRHREPERHHEPERHRSHRHREYDRRDDDVHDGEVRIEFLP